MNKTMLNKPASGKTGQKTQLFKTFYLLLFFPAVFLFLLSSCQHSNNKNDTHTRAYLLNHLNTKEKITLLGGITMSTKPIPRLGIPSMRMNDGPVGVRWGRGSAFPSEIAMASSWDTALVRKIGQGIGREVRGKGRNIILGPNVNIARNPLNGRTFEAFGEDPYLTSQMGVSYISGVQSEGVGATVKHFVANSQEFNRFTINENIDERTLREIYFPAFKAAVQKANPLAVMAAYNQLNGEFCSSNRFLLNKVLRDEWHYKGLIMSDWRAVHSTFPTINNALDLEMPLGTFINEKTILPALKSGKVKIATINSKVENIINAQYKLHLLPKMKYPQQLADSLLNSPESKKTALQAAIEGIVLLKNNHNVLPLKIDKQLRIAVIGPNAAYARVGGGGSAEVHPYFSISPLEALQKALKGKANVQYEPGVLFEYPIPIAPEYFYQSNGLEHGLKAEFYSNDHFAGKPIERKVAQIDYRQGAAQETIIARDSAFRKPFTVRLSGKIKAPVSGTYTFQLPVLGRANFYINDKEALRIESKNMWESVFNPKSFSMNLKRGQLYNLKLEYYGLPYNPDRGISMMLQLKWKYPQHTSINKAVAVAGHSDIALIFAGTSSHFETEGADRPDLSLPDNQDELIREVAGVNKRTVVILTTGAPVLVNQWIHKVPAVVETWFDGEYIGTAITKILLGEENPSGKLPITFPKSWKQEPVAVQNYRNNDSVVNYSEGLYVGYRHFDTKNIIPQFPFGLGLSYTTFKYSDLKIVPDTANGKHSADISFTVTNTGKRDGTEISQLYVHEENPKIDRPFKELKGFSRVPLKSGESKTVYIKLNREAFHYFNPQKKAWVIDPAVFDILIGSSSRDILLSDKIDWR